MKKVALVPATAVSYGCETIDGRRQLYIATGLVVDWQTLTYFPFAAI